MYIFMYTYVHIKIYVHSNIYTNTHKNMHKHTHTHIHTSIYEYMLFMHRMTDLLASMVKFRSITCGNCRMQSARNMPATSLSIPLPQHMARLIATSNAEMVPTMPTNQPPSTSANTMECGASPTCPRAMTGRVDRPSMSQAPASIILITSKSIVCIPALDCCLRTF